MILLSDYLKNEYGEKMYRLAFDIGCTCPNRDGTAGTGGCSFCSEGGSGDFAVKVNDISESGIKNAVEEAKKRINSKYNGNKFIAYFQSFSNTYGDIERLERIYSRFAENEEISILSIATRPDCIGKEVLEMLKRINAKKPVWIELGLQTAKEATADRFNRGYKLPVFEEAYKNLKSIGIPVIVHVILGLPGENREDMRNTIAYLSNLKPELDGIKISVLHVLSGTKLFEEYSSGQADLYDFSAEEYADFVLELIQLLPENTVIHRMTGDGAKKNLVYPLWTADKKKMVNLMHNKICHKS